MSADRCYESRMQIVRSKWFLACLGLYVCSFPFGQNFKHYMTATGEIHDLEPFFYNVFPAPFAVPFHNQLPLGNPFRPLVWYALGGLILAVICSAITSRDRKGAVLS